MSNCKMCGAENPPSKSNRPRIYCSKKCAQKKYQNEGRYYKKKNEDWGAKGEQDRIDKENRKAELAWCEANLMNAKQVAEYCGYKNSASVNLKSQLLGLEPRVVMWSGKRFFWTKEQAEKIKNQEVDYNDESNEFLQEYRRKNIEKANAYRKRPEVKARNNERRRDRLATDPALKIRRSVSALVYDAIVKKQGKTKGGSTFEHLPYTPQDLKEHLEKKFVEGMSWKNYGDWHIDHIIPQAALPYDSLTHPNFQKCWALNNLQPLWAKENIQKSSFHEGKRYSYS